MSNSHDYYKSQKHSYENDSYMKKRVRDDYYDEKRSSEEYRSNNFLIFRVE
jgi:hypothetical protein